MADAQKTYEVQFMPLKPGEMGEVKVIKGVESIGTEGNFIIFFGEGDHIAGMVNGDETKSIINK